MTEGVIAIDDPSAAHVNALVERHLEFARSTTPPAHVFALDLDGLQDPAVTFFTYRVNGDVIGMAALKHLDDEHAELKSMHTAGRRAAGASAARWSITSWPSPASAATAGSAWRPAPAPPSRRPAVSMRVRASLPARRLATTGRRP